MDRKWSGAAFENAEGFVVFVHGFLSSAEGCWHKGTGPSWPMLLAESFPSLAICAVNYDTSVFSGHYSISDVADNLHERLAQDRILGRGRKIVFVCHSMGGLVVRRMLIQRRESYSSLGLTIGLFLVASPSLGADYADWFSPIAKFLGHTQAEAMRASEENVWLYDLHKDFRRLIEGRTITIVGRELIEARLVVLYWLWFLPRVVPAMSGATYFPDPLKIEGTDHFSIACPESPDSLQHGALCELVEQATGARWKRTRGAPNHLPVVAVAEGANSLIRNRWPRKRIVLVAAGIVVVLAVLALFRYVHDPCHLPWEERPFVLQCK
jgi:pimeloyl-ACP methyl ester carboxylesterase